MRLAAIYDIHGNLPALEAVLQDIRHAEVDQIVVGGDVVPGPMPRETLACLLDLDIPVKFIYGNGERAVLAELAGTDTSGVPARFREVVRWVGQQLQPEYERLLPVFEGVNVPLVACGHTHMQVDRTIGRIRVVNAGSVGMPFGEPDAYWLLLGPDVQFRHTRYDLTKAAERVRDTNYPLAQDFAASDVLQPPSEAEALERFIPVAL
ncbi:MAG TPA: metallophosphoesterase family protein [Chloroflexia bacterium]